MSLATPRGHGPRSLHHGHEPQGHPPYMMKFVFCVFVVCLGRACFLRCQQADGEDKLGPDGRRVIVDGKHTVAAIKECKRIYDSAEGGEETHQWTANLLEEFQDGVSVRVLNFTNWDEDMVHAYCVSTHDADSNKWKQTSVKDMADVAKRAQKKVPGGCWKLVQKKLEGHYGGGSTKRTFVWRMIYLAQTIPDHILLKIHDMSLPNAYIYENKFFVGQGPDKGKRMGDQCRERVLDIVAGELAAGAPMNAKAFREDYCAPMRHAELWVRDRKQEFGALAALPAFARVTNWLYSSRARAQIMGAMRTGIPLHGTSEEQPGVEQCRLICEELRKLKNSARTEKAGGSEDGQAPSAEGAPSSGADGQVPGPEGGEGGDRFDTVVAEDVEVDPLREAATRKTDAAMLKLHHYED